MSRIIFRKEGRAKYISHLDLMRTMQRVFIRAGVQIKHTEGFNPHPYMAFALPLSVGMESDYEILDFKLTVVHLKAERKPRALTVNYTAKIKLHSTFPSIVALKYYK